MEGTRDIEAPLPDGGDSDMSKQKSNSASAADSPSTNKKSSTIDGKKIVGFILLSLFALLLFDTFFKQPEDRLLKPDSANQFLQWVEKNPYWGIGAFLVVIAVCVVFMIPVGTPLTLGCGYIYKHLYGWGLGVAVATAVSMAGSALGAVTCFLLGRYMMRDFARQWVRKYPLFDAIDVGEFSLVASGKCSSNKHVCVCVCVMLLAHASEDDQP